MLEGFDLNMSERDFWLLVLDLPTEGHLFTSSPGLFRAVFPVLRIEGNSMEKDLRLLNFSLVRTKARSVYILKFILVCSCFFCSSFILFSSSKHLLSPSFPFDSTARSASPILWSDKYLCWSLEMALSLALFIASINFLMVKFVLSTGKGLLSCLRTSGSTVVHLRECASIYANGIISWQLEQTTSQQTCWETSKGLDKEDSSCSDFICSWVAFLMGFGFTFVEKESGNRDTSQSERSLSSRIKLCPGSWGATGCDENKFRLGLLCFSSSDTMDRGFDSTWDGCFRFWLEAVLGEPPE